MNTQTRRFIWGLILLALAMSLMGMGVTINTKSWLGALQLIFGAINLWRSVTVIEKSLED